MSERFRKAEIESARLCAEMLLAHVIGCDRLRLYMDADRPASPIELDLLRSLVARALDHEPIQYLVGEAWFFSLQFHVDQRVLIPRPSSEPIVEHVLQYARAQPGFARASLADIGTGSGCLAICILKNLPDARAVATDLAADALDLAAENATHHGVKDRLDLLRGDLLEPLSGHPGGRDLHFLVSNPPYIPDHEWNDAAQVDESVRRHEPEEALRGGPDGLRFVRPLLRDGPRLLRKDGVIAVEIASCTADEASGVARANPMLHDVRILEDLDGLDRVVVARRV